MSAPFARPARPPRIPRAILSTSAPILLVCATSGLSWGDPTQVVAQGDPVLGARIYREGVVASGDPLGARVQGDVPIQGPQAACASCHQRSGLGSAEGDIVVPAVTGRALWSSRTSGAQRPAYTEESLAAAIVDGTDPTGRALDPLMPRYRLDPHDLKSLVAYLKELSTEPAPGVTPETLHFATVITDGVDPTPMLEVLETYFRDKNNRTRHPRRRLESGAWYRANVDEAYREWVLHPWRLTGSPETWRAQLDRYLADQPVFAMISGIGLGSWEPIHRFCEDHGTPCLLPNTDLPAIDSNDYYTLYFSEGVALEARALAERLREAPGVRRVLQVLRDDPLGSAAAAALRDGLAERLDVELTELRLAAGGPIPKSAQKRIAKSAAQADAIVLWLNAEDVAQLSGAGRLAAPSGGVFLSSTSLGDGVRAMKWPSANGFLLHPFSLPDELAARSRRVAIWLEKHDLSLREPRIRSQTFFACLVAREGLMHVRYDGYNQDYLLESLDHAAGLAPFAVDPKMSFGPEQRYLSKGCYVVPLGADGAEWKSEKTRWVVPSFGTAATASPEPTHHPREKSYVKRTWGVEILFVRRAAAGHMLEFRYRVLDAEKAAPLFERRTKPVLTHSETGTELFVPAPAKTGPLRNSNQPIAGRTYWMFFTNPGTLVQQGDHVSIRIGDFHVDGLVVQ